MSNLGTLLNKIVFKRFFFRKNIRGNPDWYLPIAFVAVVAFSTVLIALTSLHLYQLQTYKKNFLANKWNNIYELYLKNTSDGFLKYKKDLGLADIMEFYDGYDDYPMMIEIKSKLSKIAKMPVYLFDSTDTEIVGVLIEDKQDITSPYIYLHKELMEVLKVNAGDLVLIKSSDVRTGSKYNLPLFVRPITSTTKLKCYYFKDFMTQQNLDKRVRFYFDKEEDAFSFLFNKLTPTSEWDMKSPFYFGIGQDLHENFLLYCDSSDLINKRRKKKKTIYWDKLRIPNYFESKGITILDTILINYRVGKEKEKTLLIPRPPKQDVVENYILIHDEIIKDFGEKGDIEVVSVSMFEDDKRPRELYIQFDFVRNLLNKMDRYNDEIPLIQEKIFEYIGYASRVEIVSLPEAPARDPDTYNFIYYNNFNDQEKTNELLKKFDSYGVRWDNARWKTIIDLNFQIDEGKKRILALMITNFLIFLLFLLIKFLLRLKLELHTLGVLKCFGYPKRVIFLTYNLGYLILILIGFLIGFVPLSITIGLAAGYPTSLVLDFYFSSEFTKYCYWFVFAIVAVTFFSTTYFLRKETDKDNIYELIKYES